MLATTFSPPTAKPGTLAKRVWQDALRTVSERGSCCASANTLPSYSLKRAIWLGAPYLRGICHWCPRYAVQRSLFTGLNRSESTSDNRLTQRPNTEFSRKKKPFRPFPRKRKVRGNQSELALNLLVRANTDARSKVELDTPTKTWAIYVTVAEANGFTLDLLVSLLYVSGWQWLLALYLSAPFYTLDYQAVWDKGNPLGLVLSTWKAANGLTAKARDTARRKLERFINTTLTMQGCFCLYQVSRGPRALV